MVVNKASQPDGDGHGAGARSRSVTIGGLRKTEPSDERDLTVQLNLDEDVELSTLWQELKKQGYAPPEGLLGGDATYKDGMTKTYLYPYEEIKVIEGPSSAQQINVADTFLSHANAHHGVSTDFFRIEEQSEMDSKHPPRSIQDGRGFKVSFQRTPRMPDDNKLHQLPGSLGEYVLYNVEAYADRLPDNIVKAGGVFLPMWQREAMWINFDMSASYWSIKYAVRVFIGKVNAVSGKLMDEEKESDLQDYVVIPGQRWLDGICVAPGVVRQFVAMPLGSGYTVEGQKTSEEKHGGLQIEVIPELQKQLRWWVRNGEQHVQYDDAGSALIDMRRGIDENTTPEGVGLRPGDIVRSYPSKIVFHEPCKVKDLFYRNEQGAYKALYPPPQRQRENQVDLTAPLTLSGSSFLSPSPSQPVLSYGGVTRGSSDPAPLDVYGNEKMSKHSAAYARAPDAPDAPPARESNTQHKSAPSRGQLYGNFDMSDVDAAVASLDDDLYASAAMDDFDFDDTYKSSATVPDSQTSKGDDVGISMSLDDEDEEDMAECPPSPTVVGDTEAINIETKNLKAMGLAAGGKLIQDIYKDPYPATIWNHAAARIVHVHILDPASCEKVTHVVPLPPPQDAKAYADAGGQFYVVEEQVDNRVDGGDFDNIKSVSAMDEHVGLSTEEEFDPLKPKVCRTCEIRLCDCIIRPCNHQFCNVCIRALEASGTQDQILARKNWRCPICSKGVSHVAGFSAPMNLPGEEPIRMKVPVNVLEINDGRTKFKSIQKTRI